MQVRSANGKVGAGDGEDVASDPSTELDRRVEESDSSDESDCSSTSCSDEASDDDAATDEARGGAVGSSFGVEETVLIFDWDDTLLPSSWIAEQGLTLTEDTELSEEQRTLLDRLADQVCQTLAVAKRFGKVLVVTNAERGWIEMSCEKFMPSVQEALSDIALFSARSEYEQQGIASPFEWKYLAFETEIGSFCRTLDAGARKNVISLGDSAHEREALIRVTERLQNCCTKSLKLVERPDVGQLLKEHQLMAGCFRDIVNHEGNLDLCIRCS